VSWKCRGCLSVQDNPRAKKCQACEKPRPKKRRAKHMAALDLPYDAYVAVNGGLEECGICTAKAGSRRLHRDHEHVGQGRPRGLLCFRCNAALRPYMTLEWVEAAAAYLRRAA
jgi:hypothetical protein